MHQAERVVGGPRGSEVPRPQSSNEAEEGSPGEGQTFCTQPTEEGRPAASSVGDGLCEGSVH